MVPTSTDGSCPRPRGQASEFERRGDRPKERSTDRPIRRCASGRTPDVPPAQDPEDGGYADLSAPRRGLHCRWCRGPCVRKRVDDSGLRQRRRVHGARGGSTDACRSHHQQRTGMDIQIMITVSGLTKHYGERIAVDELSFDVARRTGHRIRRPERRRQVDDDADDGRAHPSRPRRRPLSRRSVHTTSAARAHRRLGARCPLHAPRPDGPEPSPGDRRARARFPRIESTRSSARSDSRAPADQRAGGFSLGMRQRLALAGALLGEPEALLLDEPSNGLDPDGIRWLRNSLSDFAARGGTVFVSSHLIGELAMFADDLVVVGGGKLLAAEAVSTTLARRRFDRRRPDTPGGRARPPPASRGHRVRHLARPTLSIHGATTATVSQLAFDHQIQVVEITETSRSLEEILLEMTGAIAEFAGLNRRAHLTHRIPPTASIRRDPCHCHDEGTHLHDHHHPPHHVGLGRASIAHRPSPPAIPS